MAKMFPHRYDESETSSAAERRLFDLFRVHLSDQYSVFHGTLLQAEWEAGIRDVEIDFVIAHQDYGILMIEVKGGRIVRDGPKGDWYTIDRHDKQSKIKNPVLQIRNAAHTLERHLKTVAPTFEWPPYYAVAFPDAEADHLVDTGLSHNIVLDKPLWHPQRIEQAVESIFKHHRKAGKWDKGDKAVARLAEILAPSYILGPSLATEFEDEAIEIKQLTDAQFNILNHRMKRDHRLVVTGVAGSGKTLLAMKRANQLAAAGQKVLYLCFNQYLAESLRERTIPDGLIIRHFHALAYEYSGIAEYSPELEKHSITKSHYYDGVLPNALLQVAEKEPERRFDAVFVDEGQDFKGMFWPAVYALLKDRQHSPLYIFCDDSQRIYSHDVIPGQFATEHLEKNMRNVKEIGEFVRTYRRAEGDYEAAGPTPKYDVRLRRVKKDSGGDGLLKALDEVIHTLTKEKVRPDQIIILTPQSKQSSLNDGQKVGPFTLKWGLKVGKSEVSVETIQAFKGLEREIVILVELDRAKHLPQFKTPESRDQLFYVGASRAKHKLIIVGEMPNPGE